MVGGARSQSLGLGRWNGIFRSPVVGGTGDQGAMVGGTGQPVLSISLRSHGYLLALSALSLIPYFLISLENSLVASTEVVADSERFGEMARVGSMKSLGVRRLLTEDWSRKGARGSHHEFRQGAEALIVPHLKEDLPTGTARAIARAAGWL